MNFSQNELKRLLHYDAASGIFTWRVRTSNRVKPGDRVGTRSPRGYVRISVFGRVYAAGRLAWFYMTGCWPLGQIDHRNTARDDNRWDNLRDATGNLNQQNRRGANKNNRTGLVGVSVDRHGKFFSRIYAEGRHHYLGYFTTAGAAHAAYKAAKRHLHLDAGA